MTKRISATSRLLVSMAALAWRHSVCTLAFAFALLPTPALSAVIVIPDSTYATALHGTTSGQTNYDATFDGTSETFTRNFVGGGSVAMTLNESQTDLGNGQFRILFQWRSDGDMAPVSGETFGINIGRTSNPLDLIEPVRLTSAILQFANSSGVLAVANGVNVVENPDPWDGFIFGPGVQRGFTNVGGLGLNAIDLQLTVSVIPEPETLALFAIGLAGLGFNRRKRTDKGRR